VVEAGSPELRTVEGTVSDAPVPVLYIDDELPSGYEGVTDVAGTVVV
jgi:hypothetical protein